MIIIHRVILRSCTFGLFVGVFLSSSCATTARPSAVGLGLRLPATVAMNKDAGRGGHLYVTLRLETGEKLLFMVDTGSAMMVLDRSLEPRLGECLGTETLLNFGKSYDASCYPAPKVCLGSAPLVTDSNALTSDILHKMSSGTGRPVMGVLGMDTLRHYCIQLDFKAGKMRFLHPNRVEPAKLGTAFPLTFSTEGQSYARWIRPYIRHADLAGGEPVEVLIDTGYNGDGGLEPERFRRAISEQRLRAQAEAEDAREPNNAEVAKCVWNGATYTGVHLGKGENSLGLRFLARHLVTFDFPRRTMYLKRTSSGPLAGRGLTAATKTAGRSTFALARKLWKNGQLPGWPKQDGGLSSAMCHLRRNPDTVTLDTQKKGDSSIYHYEFTRASKDDPWKLQKAWRTDQDGRMMEEYPVP